MHALRDQIVLQNSKIFQNIYEERIKRPEYQNYTKLDFFGSPYDSIWTLAVALDTVDRWFHEGVPGNYCEDATLIGELVKLEEFDYRNKKMGCLLRAAVSSVNFTGITVSF